MTTNKIVTFGDEARDLLVKGVNILADAVGSTLGPKGNNVIIETGFKVPTVTKDGVTVAKSIHLDDSIPNLAVQIIKETSAKTADEAGDGTTTAAVIAQALVNEGIKHIKAGTPAIQIKRELESLAEDIVYPEIKIRAQQVSHDSEDITKIATISANNDPKIGKLIGDTMNEVGIDGVIIVKESPTGNTYIEKVDGMEINKGLVSPYFMTNPQTQAAEFEKPYVLVSDKKIDVPQDLVPILEATHTANRPLLIIADEVSPQIIHLLTLNRINRGLKVAVIKAPGYADRRKKLLQDIATITGATVISDEAGLFIKDTTIEHLGEADSVSAGREKTSIIGGKGSQEQIQHRIIQIKGELENSSNSFLLEDAKKRLASLQEGVAVLYVGAPTDAELSERKDRVDDALRATKAALEEGIIPGGGLTLYRISKTLNDSSIASQILTKALQSPFSKIVENCGKHPESIAMVIDNHENEDYGYDAATDTFTDLLESGIIDPAKVTLSAVKNAISAASLILMTNATVHTDGEQIDMSQPPM
jgi:chaperonin GroEL